MAKADAPENPVPTHSFSHPSCHFSQGQGHQAHLTDVPVSLLCECGHGGEGGEGLGDRMGVGQHLQHLLICITTDTLLDQENGARNNKGSLGGGVTSRGYFPASNTHTVLGAGGQPHSWPQVGEVRPLFLIKPQTG
jgi:hypothetical protein